MKKLIFLCIAIAITTFSVIVLNISPAINELGSFDYHDNCLKYSDKYNLIKDKKVDELITEYTDAYIELLTTGNTYYEIERLLENPEIIISELLDLRYPYFHPISDENEKKMFLDLLKEGENKCKNNKAIVGLEYTSFIINIVFGFSSSFLGLLYFLGVGNNLGKINGFIGLGAGVIGFVLTSIYAIYSGIIFNNNIAGKSYLNFFLKYKEAKPKIDSDGAYMKWDESKNSYVCIFYDQDNKDSLYLKYSDYRNEFLNYKKDIAYAIYSKNFKYQKTNGCVIDILKDYRLYFGRDIPIRMLANYVDPYVELFIPSYKEAWQICRLLDEKVYQLKSNSGMFSYYDDNNKKLGDCDKLFYLPENNPTNEKKDVYDKWVTSIALSWSISVFNIGLAVFGVLLLKDSKGLRNGSVSIK